jgi:2-hydroxychromene-2-carboxylate isomerase
MGQIVDLAEARADRSRASRAPASFFFALDCPISYLAAECVERIFGEIDWVPLAGPAHSLGVPCSAGESNLRTGDRLAIAANLLERLQLPLIEPDGFPLLDGRPAARAALRAGELGEGRRFALAALRLAFCGGYDLSDREVIAEAAIASDLPADELVGAADDPRYDVALDATRRGMLARGVTSGPAIRIGSRWFEGLEAVPGASTVAGSDRTPRRDSRY